MRECRTSLNMPRMIYSPYMPQTPCFKENGVFHMEGGIYVTAAVLSLF